MKYKFTGKSIDHYDSEPCDEKTHVGNEVNSPAHYKKEGGIECIDYMKQVLTPEEFIGYLRGNVIKYNHRADYKGKKEQDLAKAEWYLNRLNKEIN